MFEVLGDRLHIMSSLVKHRTAKVKTCTICYNHDSNYIDFNVKELLQAR